jgi:hypothetical protein
MNEDPKMPVTEVTGFTELIPLNVIRTETVLSRMPIHNLAKKGKVDINITQRDEFGEVDLRWEVSYSDRYGQPRQLGYKVDTIVINRRIEEAGRPIPEMIRLGSLREIALELGLGNDTPSIKKALIQNASAFINARMEYKTNDKRKQKLEAAFTRYSVIFTGERFADGSKADAVYIKLNSVYRDVLNNAPVRPLNYDYLRELNPGAQRFYEIVSRNIFLALKLGKAEAWLDYSEYCTYSAQQRYFDYDRFKKQMYKIHRPHVQSGYLKSVRYQELRDKDGKVIDWRMLYTPGPKARAEFQHFTRSGKVIEVTETMKNEVQVLAATTPSTRRKPSRQRHFSFVLPVTATAPNSNGDTVQPEIITALVRRGISESKASQLAATAADPGTILDQLEWGDEQIRRAPGGQIRNPAGFYIHLLKEGVQPPAGFETSRRRQLKEKAREAEQAEQYRQLLLEDAYNAYRKEAIATFVSEHHLESELEELVKQSAKAIRAQWRADAPATTVMELADRKARETMAERIQPALMTFEVFRNSEQAHNIGPAIA